LDVAIETVYEELRAIARAYFRREPLEHTLEPTALVHEALLRISGSGRAGSFHNVDHLIAVGARVMRQILVDHARRRGRRRRLNRMLLARNPHDAGTRPDERAVDVLTLDELLSDLERVSPRRARVVELRFFAGLTVEETASVLEVSPKTVEADWTFVRAWLRTKLDDPS